MPDVLLVLGMHRKWSPSVAGVFSLLGAAPPQNLMPENMANERGYFKSVPSGNSTTSFYRKRLTIPLVRGPASLVNCGDDGKLRNPRAQATKQ
jgi:hypothetical protein